MKDGDRIFAAFQPRRHEMKLPVLIAGLCILTASVDSDRAFAQATQTVTKYVTVDGDVIRYEPGRTIVIRGTDSREVVYNLSPGVVVPTDVRVGRRVTLYTEPGTDGGVQLVSRVTTTSVTAEGTVQRTTEDTRNLPSGATTKTTTTQVSGRVESYEAGKTLTITRADGTRVTYFINAQSTVPTDLVVGKTIHVLPLASSTTGGPFVQTITYVTVPPPGGQQ